MDLQAHTNISGKPTASIFRSKQYVLQNVAFTCKFTRR
jgi:hypothetical protein